MAAMKFLLIFSSPKIPQIYNLQSSCTNFYSPVNTQKFYLIKSKSDCICHFPIDLEPSGRTFVWLKINRKLVNTIWFRFDLISFRKDFSVYAQLYTCNIYAKFHCVLYSCKSLNQFEKLEAKVWIEIIIINCLT